MANPQVPWLLMRPEDQALQMQKMALAGTGLDDSAINEMAAQAAPISKPETKPKDMVVPPRPPSAPQMPITSMSETIKTTSAAPGIEQQAAEARARLQKMQEDRFATEEAGIADYDKEIQKYATQKRDIDWRPLAALVDQWAGGGNTLAVANSLAPESEEQRRQKMLAMKQGLQSMKSGLSKSQYDALKDQLDSYNAQMNAQTAEKRLQASIGAKDQTQGRLNANDIEKQVIDISKRLGDANAVIISQKIDRLDQNIPGGLFGSGDIPGIGIGKNWSPQFLLSEEGSPIRQDAKALLVESIKAATGLAATEAEQQAQAQINGLSKSSTAREFRNALANQVKDNLARASEIVKTYRPEAQETYKSRQGKTVVDILGSVNAKDKKSAGGGADLAAAAAAEIARRKAANK